MYMYIASGRETNCCPGAMLLCIHIIGISQMYMRIVHVCLCIAKVIFCPGAILLCIYHVQVSYVYVYITCMLVHSRNKLLPRCYTPMYISYIIYHLFVATYILYTILYSLYTITIYTVTNSITVCCY